MKPQHWKPQASWDVIPAYTFTRTPRTVAMHSLPCGGRGGSGWGCLCFSAMLIECNQHALSHHLSQNNFWSYFKYTTRPKSYCGLYAYCVKPSVPVGPNGPITLSAPV